MALQIRDRLMHAYNAFTGRTQELYSYSQDTVSDGGRPGRQRTRSSNERSIIAAIYNRIGIDVADIDLMHVRTDDNKRFLEEIDSGLNSCLTLEANLDQAASAFKQDMAMSMFEEGSIAIVPVDTTINPELSGGYDIKTMRVGTIIGWLPQHVRVRVYDERTGTKKDLVLFKSTVAIVENPFYSVMNEPNSTLQRLIRKLNYLDAIDKASSSGKLDVIIQLPYVVKNDNRQKMAEDRRKNLEVQMRGSEYGIGYIDGTEKITQLNRPVENNLLTQVQYLTDLLYSQLGITQGVMDGSADEKTMLNYYRRTVDPVVKAIAESMRRTFLTQTARTQKQTIMYFRDPFKFIELSSIAEIADKFTRNEIATGNEARSWVGMRPSKDKSADQLKNKNMPEAKPTDGVVPSGAPPEPPVPPIDKKGDVTNGA